MSLRETIEKAFPEPVADAKAFAALPAETKADHALAAAVRLVFDLPLERLELVEWASRCERHNDANRPIGMDPGEIRWIRVPEIPDTEFAIGWCPRGKFVALHGEMTRGFVMMGEHEGSEDYLARTEDRMKGAQHANATSLDVCRWTVRGWRAVGEPGELRPTVAAEWDGRTRQVLTDDDLDLMDARDWVGPVAGEVLRFFALRTFRRGANS